MAAVFRRLLSARLQAAGAALPTGMPSEGKSRNNRPRQRTSRLWMPRNGNRLKQRTSGSEAEERTPADAVLRQTTPHRSRIRKEIHPLRPPT